MSAQAGNSLDSRMGIGQTTTESAHWYSGDYSLTLGVSTFATPDYYGADSYRFGIQPLVSFGRQNSDTRFSSRNDNVSFALVDTGRIRFGPTGKLVFSRDSGDSNDLIGLNPVRFGAELGAFAEYYPLDWLRVRGELRHGVRAHNGLVGNVNVDAFNDITPVVRLSGGPRVAFASSDYFDTYYGVTAAESVASGLTPYNPGGGFESVGLGGAVTWKTTDTFTTSLFGEYQRLVGPAEDSSLVQQRGSVNQFTAGVSATYRFDFTLR